MPHPQSNLLDLTTPTILCKAHKLYNFSECNFLQLTDISSFSDPSTILSTLFSKILTAMVKGHGKTRTYLHPFKILENANCPCSNGDQSIEHLIYKCSILHTQRELLKSNVIKSGNWPVKKHELIEVLEINFTVYKIDKF